MKLRLVCRFGVPLFLLLLVAGCASVGGSDPGNGKIKVATTIGMIGDIVTNVGGEQVEVSVLMGPGVDPHLYKPSAGDIAKLQNAEMIFYGGLNLEGRMGDILVKMASSGKPTVPVSESIPDELILDDGLGHADPHIWFDVSLWMKATEVVRDRLVAFDPSNRKEYESRTQAYLEKLDELHQYAKSELAKIPKHVRVLVTAHDAFGYFGRAYSVEVIGLQGISTESEVGLADIQGLVTLLTQRQIKAVFVESSVPRQAIEAVVEGAKAKGHALVVGGELFSDAMGEQGKPEGTYVGMVRHNVETIVKSLQ